jgi:hypothetical protein
LSRTFDHLTRSGDGAIFLQQDAVLAPALLILWRIEYRISNKQYRTAEVFLLQHSLFCIRYSAVQTDAPSPERVTAYHLKRNKLSAAVD